MPASEVMSLYRQHKLHSGPGGPVVKKKKQAVAIQISMARKEGHNIPKPDEKVKGSFQHGGLVPETGNYQVHRGEEVMPFSRRMPLSYPTSVNIEDRRQDPNKSHIGTITSTPEFVSREGQAADIAHRTGEAEQGEWRAAMRERRAPYEIMGGPEPTGSAHYAVEGLKGNVAERMRQQGEAAVGGGGYSSVRPRELPMSRREVLGGFEHGGTVPETGNYKVHAGEELVPDYYAGATHQNFSYPVRDTEVGGAPNLPSRYSGATEQNFTWPVRDTEVGAAPDIRRPVVTGTFSDANAPAPARSHTRPPVVMGSFDEGGTVQQTGDYQAHQGELVMPPPERASAPAATSSVETPSKRSFGFGGGGGGPNPFLQQMQGNVNSPLHRVEGFKHGGTIPRTGIYRLHAGEHVIPKSLAGRYREMKEHA